MRNVNRDIVILYSIVFLSYVGLALPVPVLTSYFLALPKFEYIQSYLYLSLAAYPLGDFIATPIIANISDKFGRKNVMIFCLTLSCVGFVLTGIALYSQCYNAIVLFRFFNGVFEGNSSVAYAAISDRFDGNIRKQYFGYINAALSSGYVLGPLLGGVLVNTSICSYFSYPFPFYVAGTLTFVALVITCCFFSKDKFRNVVVNKKGPHRLLIKIKSLDFSVKFLIAYGFFITLGVDIIYQFLPIFSAKISNLNAIEIGMIVSMVTLFKILSNIFLIKKMGSRFGEGDSIVIGTIITALSLTVILIFKDKNIIYLLIPFIGMSIALMVTNLLSLVSRLSSDDEQALSISLVMSLRVLGAFIILLVYSGVTSLYANLYALPLCCSIIFVIIGAGFIKRFDYKRT